MHPENYQFGSPDGQWIGRLDSKQWGKNMNLILYFTDEATGKGCWLSVFSNDNYRPRDGQINFKEEEPGGRYKLNTGRSPKGNPTFLGATKIE